MKTIRTIKRRRRSLAKTNKEKKLSRSKITRVKRVGRGFNKIYWLIATVIISLLLFMAGSIIHQYKKTLDWEKNDSKVTMASQSLDLLYDKDPESKKAKMEFKKLRDSLLNKDGTLTANADKSSIKKMKSLLDKINIENSDDDYKKMYAEVALKFSLERQYDDLFKDKDTKKLAKGVTPKTIAELNEKSFNDLSALFVQNPNDKFVSDFLKKEQSLMDDVVTFNSLVEVFNNTVVVNGKDVTLKDGYNGNLQNEFDAVRSKLSYNWASTEYMENLVTMLKPINEQVNAKYSKYAKYQDDMAAKDAAYYSWKLTQEDFFATVKAIHDQAIAEKRAREEAARIKKQLEDAKVQAKKYIDELPEISADSKNNYKVMVDGAETMAELNRVIDKANSASNEIKDKRAADEAKRKAETERKEKEAADEAKRKEEEAKNKEKTPENTTDSASRH